MRVLLAGGGTAGHTSPLLATADALRRLDPDVEITCLGTPRGLETRVVPEAGYPLELIPPVPLPRRPDADLLKVPGPAARRGPGDPRRSSTGSGPTWSSATAATSRCRPTSRPAGVALPLVVHEQNALPGLANKAGARLATRVAVSFPDTPLPRAEYVGLPIRRMISELDRAALRAEARRFFGLDPDRPTLLVTGGSQGARRLNQVGLRCRPARWPTPGSRCCTSRASTAGRSPEQTGDAVRRPRLLRPDGPRLRRGRPDHLPRRRQQRHRGRRRPACRRSSCRCRSATASRTSTPGRSSTPGGALLVDDADLTPEWVGGDGARAGHRRPAAGGDGRRGGRPDPAGRRREAGPDRPRGSPGGDR